MQQKLKILDGKITANLVYPAQAHFAGNSNGSPKRRFLSRGAEFKAKFEIIRNAQIEIVGLHAKSLRTFMRGELRRRCLGLREPEWVVCNNGGVVASLLRGSSNQRVAAVNVAN